MSLLYPNENKEVIKVESIQKGGIVCITFSSNNGKHGTDEILDEIEIESRILLNLLQERRRIFEILKDNFDKNNQQ